MIHASPSEAPGGRTFGIDCRAAAEVSGGRGTVVRELLRALARSSDDNGDRYILYARRGWDGVELDYRFQWVLLTGPDPVWHIRAADHASRTCDAFLATNSYLTPWLLRIPAVMMLMDMVAFQPAYSPRRSSVLIERTTLPWALRRASSVACISSATAQDLVKRFPSAKSRATVTPLAASPAFAAVTDADAARVRTRHGLTDPYVLSVGTLEPRKNLGRLIEAFAGLETEERRGARLALVGARGWAGSDLDDTIRRNQDLLTVLGYVDEDDLPGLYRGAEAFAYPSLYEGFGLPVLEAMHTGTPVVTSDISSLPEVAGDTALYADPLSVDDIRRALRQALSDDPGVTTMAAAAAARAASYSWDTFASSVQALLVAAVAGRRPMPVVP